jgi:hypothetical protein
MANLNPLEIKIKDVTITKFNGTDKMSILPQFVEFTIYQSIFEPSIKAEMLVNDQIGLFANYPFTGEELVTISYEQVSSVPGTTGPGKSEKDLKFIIKGVRDIIIGDRARSLMYVVDLVSPQFLQNVRKYVSHAYYDRVEDMAEKVYQEYINEPTKEKYNIDKPFNKEESLKVRSLVVPNVRPFQGIQWLAKHAVAKDYENHFIYLFYEDLERYNFITLQQIVEEALKKREELRAKKFRFVSDTEVASSSAAAGDPDQDKRLITNIVNNKRFSSIEKISGGYYQNELFEISLLQKAFNSTPTELKDRNDTKFPLEKFPLNTKEYIAYVKNETNKTEYSNRIRYIINNYQDFDGGGRSQPGYRYKFGNTTKYMYALNQIDLTITVPANMDLKAGDVIYCDIPENHGFNNVETDKYISGLFVVTEAKHVISFGGRAATSLRINKDGYLNSLFENSLYNTSSVLGTGMRAGGPR